MARQRGALGPHPVFQCGNQRLDSLLPDGMPLLGRETVDCALDGEDLVDTANRFDRQWRLPQIGQHKELATAVCPARGFGNVAHRLYTVLCPSAIAGTSGASPASDSLVE